MPFGGASKSVSADGSQAYYSAPLAPSLGPRSLSK